MYKRLTILSFTIGLAVLAMAILGYLVLQEWKQGLQGQRLGEFARTALQVQSDVKQKLDRFIMIEQSRPYTDYYPYHLPDANLGQSGQVRTVVRSPLWGRLDHGLAYGHFQVQPDGSIVTPNDDLIESQDPNLAITAQIQQIKSTVGTRLLPLLRPVVLGAGDSGQPLRVAAELPVQAKAMTKAKSLPIESLQNIVQRQQVIHQDRQWAYSNIGMDLARVPQPSGPNVVGQRVVSMRARQPAPPVIDEPRVQQAYSGHQLPARPPEHKMEGFVTVKIDPLVPIVLRDEVDRGALFGASVYMVRHVQVEELHLFQGFRLDASRLLAEVDESARRFIRGDMGFELSSFESAYATYAALLDFGFGSIVLNLKDLDAGQITEKARWLYRWYFGSVGLVVVVISIGLAALWHGAWQQLRLSKQKDNFISAVSHELRTPLAGISMCAEMLEKGWVLTEQQRHRYYQNIRQEGQRLGRLIENVLDFSRIQQGRQRYQFIEGDLNGLVRHVVETTRHLAEGHGLTVQTDLAQIRPFAFDHDAVTQILLNLIDNAIKFANPSADNTIIVHTRADGDYALIEVEDHGPGIPPAERQRIFEEFYRIEPEATRKTCGVGLGLALARCFALAHNGFIHVTDAQPHGAKFTVGLHM